MSTRRSTRLQARDTVDDADDSDYEEAAPIKWLKCQSCSQWRKLSDNPSVNETILQSVDEGDFVCSQNTWAPELADCSVPEESGHWNDVWNGMPEEFGKGAVRDHFYQIVTKAGFSNGRVNEPFPILYNHAVDLYRLYVVVESVGGRDKLTRGLDAWLPLGKLMNFPETDMVATRLRQLHTRFIAPSIKYAADKDDPLIADYEKFELENPNGPSQVSKEVKKSSNSRSRWSDAEDAALKAAVAELGHGKWTRIATSTKWGPLLSSHNVEELRGRYRSLSAKQGPTSRSASHRPQNQSYQRTHPLHAPTSYLLRRPYPAKLFDMPIHRKATRAPVPGAAPSVDEESEDSGAESDDEDSSLTKLPHFQYYAAHKQDRVMLSETVSIPLRSLRRHLVVMLHFDVDNAVKLLQSLSQATETSHRSALLGDAIMQHFFAMDRKGPWKAMSDASNQNIKAERKRRFDQTMLSHETAKRQKLAVEQSRLEQQQQMSTPAQSAYPTTSSQPIHMSNAAINQSVPHASQPVNVPNGQPANTPTNTLPRHLVSNGVPNQYARPHPMQYVQMPMQPPAARRIYRLPTQQSPPSSNGSSPIARPNPLAAHRAPLLTTKRRQALEASAVKLQQAIANGVVIQDTNRTAPIDDSDSVLGDQKAVLDMIPITNLLQFVPPGVRVSSLIAIIDPATL